MPKSRRLSSNLHHSSVKKADAPSADEGLDLPSPTAEEQAPALLETPVQLTKKERLQEKRTNFLQKFDPSGQRFSKSHERRMKRKARDQLAGETLEDLSTAIATMEKEALEDNAVQTISEAQDADGPEKKPQKKAGVIGEGKSAPLSKAQRKRAFALERLRHPLILQNPEFTSNPFQTIRTHAQNTLVKHTPS